MRIFDLFKLSTRSFRSRTSRTFLTILGVAVGIGVIIFLVSFGNGLQKLLLERITTDEALLTLDVSPPPSEIIALSQESLEKIRATENVESVSPLGTVAGQISFGELNADVTINIAEALYLRLSGLILSKGELFKEGEQNNVIVSKALLTAFNMSQDQAIGEEVSFVFFVPKPTEEEGVVAEEIEIYRKEEKHKVTGVIEEEIIPLAFVPAASLKDLPIVSYSQAKVKVKDDKHMESVRDAILSQGFFVSSLSETVDQAKKIFGAIQLILFIFGVISLIVAAIGLINTMTISLLERTNEIGIMRAIGAAPRDVQRMFIAESTVIGFFGGIVGILLGVIGAEIFNDGVNILAKVLGAESLRLFAYPLWFLFFVVFLSTGVGFIAGIWPARRAGRLNPLRALRYK